VIENFQVSVEPWWRDLPGLDGLIYAVGYESRSRYCASELQGEKTALLGLRFGDNEVVAFSANLEWATSRGEVAMAKSYASCQSEVGAWMTRLSRERGTGLRIGLDVSSLSRKLIAASLLAILSSIEDVVVVLLYAPAKYEKPTMDVEGPIVKFGAVAQELAGLSEEVGRGTAAIIGLGYEPELALATYEGLEPTTHWLAVPFGVDQAFDRSVQEANAFLLEVSGDRTVSYDVLRPFETFVRMESLVDGLRRQRNVILCPLGPKIFAAVAMVVGIVHWPNVGVWRVSAEQQGIPQDRVPSGPIVGLVVRSSVRGSMSTGSMP